MNVNEPLRKCIRCGLEAWIEDDLEKFVKAKDHKYGRRSECKVCFSKKQSEYDKLRRQKLREQKPLRKCRTCGLEAWTEDDLELFAKAKKNKYGRRNQCKKCFAADATEYRKRRWDDHGLCRRCHKPVDRSGPYCSECCEELKEYNNRRHWEKRLKAILKLGGQCIKCGITDPRLMTINHKKGRNYRTTVDRGHSFYTKILNGERKTDDLEIRCYNCNILYEFEQGHRQIPETLDPEIISQFSTSKVDYLYGF